MCVRVCVRASVSVRVSVYVRTCVVMLSDEAEQAAPVRLADKRRLFRWKIAFRLFASVPSLAGSLFVNNLGDILDYTGAAPYY